MAEPLPPGVSVGTMAETLEKFRRIVGQEWVFSGEQVASYHDPVSYTHLTLPTILRV